MPKLDDPGKGIFAFPINASNTSRMSMTHYFKVYPEKNADLEVTIFPNEGDKFVFSPKFAPGEYTFKEMRIIFDNRAGITKKQFNHAWLYGLNNLKIEPGAITVVPRKLVYKQYSVESLSGDYASRMNFNFEDITADEMDRLIEELKKIDSNNQWKIISRKISPTAYPQKTKLEELQEAADDGFADAQFSLGVLYEKGKEVPKDIHKAYKFYKKSAEEGFPAAMKKIETLCKKSPELCENN